MFRFRTALSLGISLSVAAFASVEAQATRPVAAPRADERPVWPDEGPATWAPQPTESAITANDLRTRLYQFADDSMEGRRIGEPGNYKGTAYIAREFERLGLRPAGENGSYFQVMPYGTMAFARAASRLTVGRSALAVEREWVPVAPSGFNGFGGTADLANVPTVFAGRWGDTTALPASVAGKVAVFIATPSAAGLSTGGGRDPLPLPSCDSVPDRFGADAAIRWEAAQRAAGGNARRGGGRGGFGSRDTRAIDAGAKGILLIALDSVPRESAGAVFRERSGMRPAESTDAPAAAISSAAAARIFGKPVSQLAVGATGQPVSGRWNYEWKISPTPARNVIAVLPGSDPARAGEYVLVSAHNDHVGINQNTFDHDSLRAANTVTRRQGANDPQCRPNPEQQHRIDSLIARARSIRPIRRDSIMNGADDDGSGTVVLLEIAEQFAREHPARSIVFVSHNGEEGGLLGSRWFTDHPTIPLDSVVAAHNMDMVGKGRVEQVKFGGPNSIQMLGARRLSREFGDIIDSVNAISPMPMAIDKSWDVTANPLNRFCRSDQVNYVRHDVPVTYFSLGYAQDYHQATDEPRYVDYDHAARVGQFVHDVMKAVADRKDKPAIAGPDPAYPRC